MRNLLVVIVAIAPFCACNKGESLEQIRQDGVSCAPEKGNENMKPSGKEHLFLCPDDGPSMKKCGDNPLTSGCKEKKN